MTPQGTNNRRFGSQKPPQIDPRTKKYVFRDFVRFVCKGKGREGKREGKTHASFKKISSSAIYIHWSLPVHIHAQRQADLDPEADLM